jgi:hypothetical protein
LGRDGGWGTSQLTDRQLGQLVDDHEDPVPRSPASLGPSVDVARAGVPLCLKTQVDLVADRPERRRLAYYALGACPAGVRSGRGRFGVIGTRRWGFAGHSWQ